MRAGPRARSTHAPRAPGVPAPIDPRTGRPHTPPDSAELRAHGHPGLRLRDAWDAPPSPRAAPSRGRRGAAAAARRRRLAVGVGLRRRGSLHLASTTQRGLEQGPHHVHEGKASPGIHCLRRPLRSTVIRWRVARRQTSTAHATRGGNWWGMAIFPRQDQPERGPLSMGCCCGGRPPLFLAPRASSEAAWPPGAPEFTPPLAPLSDLPVDGSNLTVGVHSIPAALRPSYPRPPNRTHASPTNQMRHID